MFTSRQYVIDAGAAHVAAGIFARGAGGKLVLDEFAAQTRVSDPSLESDWVGGTAQAIASVTGQWTARGPASLAVPGHLALTKFVKTSAVGPATREQVVQFEVAQNIPFQLDEVTWDYLVVAGDDLDLEIMLTAVKLEVMKNLCAAAESAGFPVKRAAATCVALYRAFRFNYPAVSGPVLLVDIGARSTNLILAGPGGRFFARTFLFAGNAITSALAEALQVTFPEAEVLKLRLSEGHATLTESGAAPAALRQAIGYFFNRLQLEITRTTGNFSCRTGAEPPVAIYLTGGGSLIPNLGPMLTGKFKLPVECYDPLRRVELSANAQAAGAASHSHLLANLVGLAVPDAAKDQSTTGLLPPALRATRAFRRRQPVLLGAATLLVLALLPPVWQLQSSATRDRSRAAEVSAELRPLRALAERNAANLRKIATEQKQMAVVQHLAEARSHWIEFFAALQSGLERVEDVWLDQLTVVRASAPASLTGPANATGPAAPLRLRLSGRLLDTHHPVSKVSRDSYERVKQLLASFHDSRFIAAVENERFDNAQSGLLRFDFTLAVNSQHPL